MPETDYPVEEEEELSPEGRRNIYLEDSPVMLQDIPTKESELEKSPENEVNQELIEKMLRESAAGLVDLEDTEELVRQEDGDFSM
jgi:hypothetical protein